MISDMKCVCFVSFDDVRKTSAFSPLKIVELTRGFCQGLSITVGDISSELLFLPFAVCPGYSLYHPVSPQWNQFSITSISNFLKGPLNLWDYATWGGRARLHIYLTRADFCCSPPHFPVSGMNLENEAHKSYRHTTFWAQGQVTFLIQHLYKSSLMKLR